MEHSVNPVDVWALKLRGESEMEIEKTAEREEESEI